MKPLLRGYIHQGAFYLAFGACCILISDSHGVRALTANIIYSVSLMGLYAISAFYHRPVWGSRGYALMRRMDHAAIFGLIAGSATPICLLGVNGALGYKLLFFSWTIAIVGMFIAMYWTHAPTGLRALLYVGAGWVALPYLPEIIASIGMTDVWLLLTGGIIYTIGACVYAFKWPTLFPAVFGYHEVFHVLVVIASAFHFAVIYRFVS
jgi:hemolysin III